MSTNITDSDIACSSAACDILRECNGQITGSHLARVARLFAEHRAASQQEGFRCMRCNDGSTGLYCLNCGAHLAKAL